MRSFSGVPTSKNFLDSTSNGKEVLLVFPGKYKSPDPQIPLALLHLASPLQRAGYRVRILDLRIQNHRDFDVGDPVFVGISCMSGLQIRFGLKFARKIRDQKPNVPIVWGGIHPTLLPEQTAANQYVDVVVRGEGETVVAELANKLALGESLDEVAGLTYKAGGTIRSNPDASLIDLDDIPVELPYDLLQLDKYPAVKSGRIHIQTSRGCPHRCGFCYNTLFNKNRWRGKSANRVLDEIEFILKKYPHINIIDPIDDNVFVDEHRVKQICQGIIDRKLAVRWRANCRFDYLASYGKDFLELLERSGCVELDFGGESGSERLQQLIHKDVTAEEMLESVDKLRRWAPSIEPYVSWMSGLPTETDEDLAQTFDLMDRMREVNQKTQHYGIFVYTPFPSPVMNYLPPEFEAPQTLEEWGSIHVFHFNPPWHSKTRVEKLHTISAVTRLAFYPQARIRERDLAFKFAYGIMNRIAKYRWRHRNFRFPIEMKVTDAVARWFKGFL